MHFPQCAAVSMTNTNKPPVLSPLWTERLFCPLPKPCEVLLFQRRRENIHSTKLRALPMTQLSSPAHLISVAYLYLTCHPNYIFANPLINVLHNTLPLLFFLPLRDPVQDWVLYSGGMSSFIRISTNYFIIYVIIGTRYIYTWQANSFVIQ